MMLADEDANAAIAVMIGPEEHVRVPHRVEDAAGSQRAGTREVFFAPHLDPERVPQRPERGEPETRRRRDDQTVAKPAAGAARRPSGTTRDGCGGARRDDRHVGFTVHG